MKIKTHQKHKFSFSVLLIIILSMFIIFPVANQFFISQLIYKIIISLIFLSVLYIFNSIKGLFIVGVVLIIPAIFLLWFSYFHDNTAVHILSDIFIFAFLVLVIICLCRNIFFQKTITAFTIIGAICIYLLIGIAWSHLYSLLEIINPHSFSRTFHSLPFLSKEETFI